MSEDGFISAEFARTRGRKLRFMGKLLGSTEYETRTGEPLKMHLMVWEARGGEYVAVSISTTRTGREDVRALVIVLGDRHEDRPGRLTVNDEQWRRDEVLEFFAWDQRAMKMATRQMGWAMVDGL